ncbi:hypothetical protein PInf_010240 [Phytophthora infestans]|nr:hypothetical protein PInf_010240 [Phytophthora infestans]
MPSPPVYRGATKKEKKAFMDTRRSEVQDPARLAEAMRALSMDASLPDAESRVMKLVTDFNEILNSQDMDDFPLEEPKMAVKFLCASLKPQALKQTVITELKRIVHKSTKKSTTPHARRPSLLQCMVNGVVEAKAKPDSGAEVSVVSPCLLQELSAKGQWMNCRNLTRSDSIEGITKEPMIITQEVKSDLQFATANGNLTLKTRHLLGGGVKGRLGYNPQELLDKARRVSGIYDMDDGSEVSGVRRA